MNHYLLNQSDYSNELLTAVPMKMAHNEIGSATREERPEETLSRKTTFVSGRSQVAEAQNVWAHKIGFILEDKLNSVVQ